MSIHFFIRASLISDQAHVAIFFLNPQLEQKSGVKGHMVREHRSSLVVLCVTLCIVALVRTLDASLTDPRRYQRDGAKGRRGFSQDKMIPLSVGIETTDGSVELCLFRGERFDFTHHRILSSDQLMQFSRRGESTSVRILTGERMIKTSDNILLTEWNAPESWNSALMTSKPAPYGFVLACSISEDMILDVSLRNMSHTADEAWTNMFHGSVATFLRPEVVKEHLALADHFLEVETPKRSEARSRQIVERLVIALLMPDGDTEDSPDASLSSEDDLLLRRAGEDSLQLLLETAGVQQVPRFWETVEAALRKRIHFEDRRDA